MLLLQQIEKLKKQEKAGYRLTNNPHLNKDIDVAPAELLREKGKRTKENVDKLRQLRKQLKIACKLTKEELAACKVKVRQQEEGYQTDSSDGEAVLSNADMAFIRGGWEGIGTALKNAPSAFLESFVDLLTNPLATIEGIIEGLSNLPELPGLIFEYLETIEGDEEAKGAEIAEFITS